MIITEVLTLTINKVIVSCPNAIITILMYINGYFLIRSPGRKKRERSPPPRPTRIHIGRLTLNVTRDHVHEIFSTYGTVKAVEFPMDRLHPHNGRGYAYVEFSNADEAENAMKHMDGGKLVQ